MESIDFWRRRLGCMGLLSFCAPRVVGIRTGYDAQGLAVVLFIPYAKDDLSFSEAAFRGYLRLRRDGYAIGLVENAALMQMKQIRAVIDGLYARGTRAFIMAGAEFGEVVTEAAQRLSDAYFATLSGHARGGRVVNYCLDCGETGGRLAGLVAAGLTRSKIVGLVGGMRAVDGAEAQRFRLQVQRLVPDATVLVDWVGNWTDRERAVSLARRQIAAGVDVLLADANDAIIAAVSDHPDVRVIGWMTDASARYSNVAASVVIRTEVVFRRFIESIVTGRFRGGDEAIGDADGVWSVAWSQRNRWR